MQARRITSGILFCGLLITTIHASFIHQPTLHPNKPPQTHKFQEHFFDYTSNSSKPDQILKAIDAQQQSLKDTIAQSVQKHSTIEPKNPSVDSEKNTAKKPLRFTIEIQKITEESGEDIESPAEKLSSFRASKHIQNIITYTHDPATGEKSMHEAQKTHSVYQDNASGQDSWDRDYQFERLEWQRTGFIKKYEHGIGQHLHTAKTTDFIYKETGCYRIKNISGQPTSFFILHIKYVPQKKQETKNNLFVVYNSKEPENPPTYLVEIVRWDGRQLTIDGEPVSIPTGKRTCKFKYGEVVLPIPVDKYPQILQSVVYP